MIQRRYIMLLKHFPILIILLLTGCASSSIDLSEMQSLPQDQGIIFGRVRVIEGGTEVKLSSWRGLSRLRLIILPDTSSKAIYVPLKEESGFFIWHLSAGSYTIATFTWDRGSADYIHGRIFADIRVLENKAAYIGTLTLSFTGSSYTTFVEDEYECSLSTFKNKFPDMKEEPIRYLMQMEKKR
jgi:hypothetical protein